MYQIDNQKKTAVILNEYVFQHTLPIEINLDDGASWKLLHGSIWCDGVSDILNRLLEVNNTRSYLVFLYANNDISPHTLSFVDFQINPWLMAGIQVWIKKHYMCLILKIIIIHLMPMVN